MIAGNAASAEAHAGSGVAEMRILAVIPARAGSKGIPGKNLRTVAGRSLLAWSISAAQSSRRGLRVIVSTDGDDIASEAQRCGAGVVKRPSAIAGHMASSEAALLHAMDELRTRESFEPDLLVFLQCTSPLTTGEDIDGTIDALLREDADSAFAAAPFHHFLWRPGASGDWEGVNHDYRARQMRQERPEELVEAGAVYVMRAQGFREAGHRFFGKKTAFVMPARRRWEIDEPHDLVVAEALLSARETPEAGSGAMADLSSIRLLILDFDGVMTDNRVMVGEGGEEGVWCHRGDGWGIARLRESGVEIVVLSTEANPVVGARCRKLRIGCAQGCDDKHSAVVAMMEARGLCPDKVAYVGNDVNDLECMQVVGRPIAVADAVPEILAIAALTTRARGGYGAVREVCDLILQQQRNTQP